METQLPVNKSLKLKRLSFDEMWKLYKVIEPSLPDKDETYLFHEIQKIMENMTNSSFKDSLLFMYGEGFQINKIPAELAIMFIHGLKQNNFFSFASFVKSLSK